MTVRNCSPARYFPQEITWWARNATDKFGQYTYSAPVVIKGRWEEKNELFRNRAGDEEVSAAVVYVDRNIEVGDYLMLGVSKSMNVTLVDAQEVKKFMSTPDIRTLSNVRKAIL